MGWIKPRRAEDDSRGRYYDLWANEDSSILARHKMHLPAPKIPLPGHQESYNPPPEYLFTEEEVRRLQEVTCCTLLGAELTCLSVCVCTCLSLSAAGPVGAAGPLRQEASVCSQQVLQPPAGSCVSSFHPREVRALPRPLPVPPPEEDEGNVHTPVTSQPIRRQDCIINNMSVCLSVCR